MTEIAGAMLQVGVAITLAPLLVGLAEKTRAWLTGHWGSPLVQPYRDLWHWVGRPTAYSPDVGWVFRAGPTVALCAALLAVLIMPLGRPAVVALEGDVWLLVGLLALMRGAMTAAALDSRSPLPVLAANREWQFAVLAMPALILGVLVLSRECGSYSLSVIFAELPYRGWSNEGPALTLVSLSFVVVMLCETGRRPADSARRHEWSQVVEGVTYLHGGVDLAYANLAAALKLWVLVALVVNTALPWRFDDTVDVVIAVLAILGVGVLIGIIEASLARLQVARVPHLLAGAAALSAIALLMVLVH